MRQVRQLLVCALGMTACGIAVLYSVLVYATLDEDPLGLLSCMNVEACWHAWTCKQVLYHASFSSGQVHELNAMAGAMYPALMNDLELAEDMLTLFLSRGVDVNARSQQSKGLTALHGLTSDRPERIALLLKHGARVDIRDEHGRTPLDHARDLLNTFQNDRNLPEIIRLLEDTQSLSR